MRGRRGALYGLAVSVLAAGLSLGAAAGDEALDDLFTAFQLTPLGDRKPTPFTLDSIDGKSISLAEVRGRAVLLYFWESG
jgi:cytochrome oxidase Cu insertion factor (SCO1/SenC/PrrC family)